MELPRAIIYKKKFLTFLIFSRILGNEQLSLPLSLFVLAPLAFPFRKERAFVCILVVQRLLEMKKERYDFYGINFQLKIELSCQIFRLPQCLKYVSSHFTLSRELGSDLEMQISEKDNKLQMSARQLALTYWPEDITAVI